MQHFLTGATEEREMLDALGLRSVDELFSDIPQRVRTKLTSPGMSEMDAKRALVRTLSANESFEKRPHFLGQGVYAHYVPAIVAPIILRGEFYTSYTPYQPEILQGMLQACFEYQTLATRLTEMEVANLSMYDGPTALGEAAIMAHRSNRKREVLVPANLFWEKKSVVANYVSGYGLKVREFAYDRATGEADLGDLESKLGADTAAVLLQNPNFFGVWESRAGEVRALLDRKSPGAFFVVDVADPFSLALAKGPGAYGADVAVGEGMALGTPQFFGGPGIGIFATKKEHVRKMPGRIVGETIDANGERAYCLTLSTREQHIRRDKATSNICSNEALNALAFAVALTALGEQGFRDAALASTQRAKRLLDAARKVPGVHVPFTGAVFDEFVLNTDAATSRVEASFRTRGLRGGLDLARWHPELGNAASYCVTELHPEDSLAGFEAALREAAR
ncbi:MAG: aminomethyl-transferring glycine dehydrogenase subunit GcvPA [Thermoplasmatota archaeon]